VYYFVVNRVGRRKGEEEEEEEEDACPCRRRARGTSSVAREERHFRRERSFLKKLARPFLFSFPRSKRDVNKRTIENLTEKNPNRLIDQFLSSIVRFNELSESSRKLRREDLDEIEFP